MNTSNSEAFKKYEDLVYLVNPLDWNSDGNMSNAINQFCSFLREYATFVEPYIYGLESEIGKFNELGEKLFLFDKKDKRSQTNKVSDVKRKMIVLMSDIKKYLEEEKSIRYKAK